MMYNNITGETPSPSRVGLVQLFNQHIKIASRDLHTQLPARVLEVDYEKGFVTVQPLIKTKVELTGDEEVELLPVDEVPILITSAKRGKARLTVPVSVGDVGIVYFAERATGVYRNSDGTKIVDSKEYSGLGFNGVLHAIGFLPEIFTASSNRKIRSDATVLEDGVSSIALKEGGDITVNNTVATLNLSEGGDLSFNNGGCTVSATSGGAVTVDAATSINLTCGGSSFVMTPSFIIINGSVFNIGGIMSNNSIAAATSLTVAGKEMDGHTHTSGTYVVGSSNVTGLSGEPS